MEGSEAVSEDEIKLIFEQATALSDKNRWYDFGGTVVYIDVEPKCICVWTKVRDKNYKSLIFLSGATTGFLVPNVD